MRTFWVLRGREAIRRQQYNFTKCRKWKSNPAVPKMADLPPVRMRLFKPAFYSTGMDCFGPFRVKIGRRSEKSWGIVFKCLTTRCVHLDVLTGLDTDSFCLALRRFAARRGMPFQVISDHGTNFHRGERELQETFAALSSDLKLLLAEQQISFRFNLLTAPDFGGVWEAILNSKLLGYVSTDVADADLVTPNILLMAGADGSHPQVVYPATELIGRRRWRQSQVLADHFWSAFVGHYLPQLQERNKWHGSSAGLAIGTVVIMADPQQTPFRVADWESQQGVSGTRRACQSSRDQGKGSHLRATCGTADCSFRNPR